MTNDGKINVSNTQSNVTEDAASKNHNGKKRNAANKNQEVSFKVKQNEGFTSQEPSTTETSEDDVEVLPEYVSLSREWVMKVNVGMDVVEIFSQHLGKVEGTLADHSAQLVGIADTLGDSPFGRFHRLLALAFNIFALRVIGRYSTTSWNYSVTRQLLHFIANLIFSFRAQHTGTKGLPVFSNQHLFQLTQDQKGLFKACNGVECKADYSAQLVEIADTFGDSPFGQFRRLLALALNIFALRVVGRYSTASQNYSAIRRLLHFIANLIFPFRAHHTGRKGDLQADRRLANWVRRSSGFHFFVLFSRLVPFC
ncbi:hypothetical protein H5410_022154 [Solanum commersonii]|uniref:Uncharacterized protein n=1 Tax=Solanum commersonii TaxID=4109 RepID=A0A9J5ZDE1_SOLCO|nr:hypothetical protein H5410_022154 [Solanum commersonii]